MNIKVRTDCRDDAFAIRRCVFMEEQGYKNEFDEVDDDTLCIHVTLYVDGELAGCARVFPEPLEHALLPDAPQSPVSSLDGNIVPDGVYLLGRVAVLPEFRHRGLASVLVQESERAAQVAGARLIKLHAQEYVQPLYAKQDFQPIAPVDYEDEGQPHVWMAKQL